MNIKKEVNNRKVTLKLEGNFTYTQRKPFQEMLKSVAVDGVDQIVIDLSQVAFLDSAALGLLMISHRQVQAEKRTLSLAYPQPTVRQIIELANLHKTIPLIE
ncbi:MAG: anti-sigma factor antagonist, partial [Nitrospira sp. CR2.1]|nr:anti-sigma factor antagonist [Nitrospira sp. CR2.1]